MDLRGILNDNAPAATTPSKPPPPPPMMPSTPVQTNPHQPFRDYSQTHPSPGRHMSMDYSLQQAPPGAYASPPAYPSAGPYPTRPAQPPPLQQISPHDLRSPSIISGGPGPSPYRQTPTSSLSASSGAYPFPPQHPSTTSPVQQQRYPPQGPYHRDSFPQLSMPGGMTGPPGGVSYMQAGPQVPQTPPVVTPGGHGYPHQRSQSTHSTSTPTSAHSQHAQYGAPFLQGSPVAAHHSLPHMEPPSRHSSQPPTPVAAPLNRSAQTMSFGQPPSPYQQRLPTATTYPPHPPSQTSPPQPHPPSLPRHSSSTTAAYDPVAHEAHRRSQSRGDRDRSLSVSPKTRVPSLPGSASRPGTSVSDHDPRRVSTHPSLTMPSAMDHERERAVTPAKRKLEDRELRPDELEKREVRPPPFENTNGRSAQIDVAPLSQSHANAFRKPLKKRTKYSNPPVWGLPLQGRRPTHANITIYRPPQHAAQAVNGTPDGPSSRHTSPEERRAIPAPHTAAAAPPPQPAVPEPVPPVDAQIPPWEPSITGVMPRDAMSKVVADFLFQYVVLHPAMGEMQSRKVQFEIEAKLGTLIDKSTGQRISLPCISECVLNDQGSWLGFRSSMSEDYHRSFNAFLNTMVQEAYPGNKDRRKPRMPIEYRHRREVDKFFELPDRERTRMLPACVANEIASRNHHAKVRVTYDQKTDEVLAKIVKARVADLNLHFPEFPLDCRISVNLEMEWDGTLEELDRLSSSSNRQPQPNRGKDRLSYIHGPFQIDLTQVTHSSQGPNNTQRMEKEHEIEIEVNPQAILEHGRRAGDGQPNHYPELVEGLLNNVRVLAKKALEFSQAQGR